MTIGTPRNEGEATSFSPGVAHKLISTPVGFLGAYSCYWQGAGIFKKTVPFQCFPAVPVSGDCHIQDFKQKSSRFQAPNIVSRKHFPFLSFM